MAGLPGKAFPVITCDLDRFNSTAAPRPISASASASTTLSTTATGGSAIMRAADEALYAAKQMGRGRAVFADALEEAEGPVKAAE